VVQGVGSEFKSQYQKKKTPTKQRNKNLSPLNIAKYLGSYVTDTDDKT
jgi:hypothetical protein